MRHEVADEAVPVRTLAHASYSPILHQPEPYVGEATGFFGENVSLKADSTREFFRSFIARGIEVTIAQRTRTLCE